MRKERNKVFTILDLFQKSIWQTKSVHSSSDWSSQTKWNGNSWRKLFLNRSTFSWSDRPVKNMLRFCMNTCMRLRNLSSFFKIKNKLCSLFPNYLSRPFWITNLLRGVLVELSTWSKAFSKRTKDSLQNMALFLSSFKSIRISWT